LVSPLNLASPPVDKESKRRALEGPLAAYFSGRLDAGRNGSPIVQDKTVFDDTQKWELASFASPTERPVLMLLDGGDIKTRHPIDAAELTIGRDPSCQIVLADGKSSRRHARIDYLNFDSPVVTPQVAISDLRSTNGTFVNGERVERAELNDRDKILIGSTLFGYFLRDETTLKADETLIRLASYDALTGLRNRGVFNLELKREFDRARRYGREMSLLMFDIDHFKKFNDTYGHQAGDRVLREIGELMSMNCRSNDVAARYGGEEFAIILPETPMENALIKAERLRKVVVCHPFATEGTALSVTISLGLAMVEAWMQKPEDLIEAADRALYKAKQGGRNQVCWNRGEESQGPIQVAC
jgi:diguanylate cyclase (GGDEF)-like protein